MKLKIRNVSLDGILEMAGLRTMPKYGLAFGGGGAKGFAHIGVMMALEEVGIHPQVFSGVSAGSIAAVLYGAGLSSDEVIECFAESQKFGDYTDWSIPKSGLFKLDRFGKLLESWLPVKNLEELKIPTVVCASNIEKGTSIGWCKGEIIPRVLASCSIPIVFQPIKINGVYYVDGGVLRNLPAWAIRDYCKILIGSNCSPLDRDFKYKESILDIADRTFQLMSKANVLQDIKLCDYVIMPPSISKSKTFDIANLRKNIKIGYDAAQEVIKTMKL